MTPSGECGKSSCLVFQTNYPSLKNLLEYYLVKGGWIPPEEAERIDVIGYPSKQSNIEEVFGLEALKESLDNKMRSPKKEPKS